MAAYLGPIFYLFSCFPPIFLEDGTRTWICELQRAKNLKWPTVRLDSIKSTINISELTFKEKMTWFFAFLQHPTCARQATGPCHSSAEQNGVSSKTFRWKTSWLQPKKSSPRLIRKSLKCQMVSDRAGTVTRPGSKAQAWRKARSK